MQILDEELRHDLPHASVAGHVFAMQLSGFPARTPRTGPTRITCGGSWEDPQGFLGGSNHFQSVLARDHAISHGGDAYNPKVCHAAPAPLDTPTSSMVLRALKIKREEETIP